VCVYKKNIYTYIHSTFPYDIPVDEDQFQLKNIEIVPKLLQKTIDEDQFRFKNVKIDILLTLDKKTKKRTSESQILDLIDYLLNS
jgi:hypothetical protein